MPDDEAAELPAGIDPVASRRIFLGMLALIAGGGVALALFRAPADPPPAAIAGDPLLAEGHAVFLARCVSCHGPAGRGDGPIAKGLAGPPVGDLTDADWKHGDRPDQVLEVVVQGVREMGEVATAPSATTKKAAKAPAKKRTAKKAASAGK